LTITLVLHFQESVGQRALFTSYVR